MSPKPRLCSGQNAQSKPNDLESAILRVLPPASYTAILQGAGGTTGVVVVEVYATN